ncbi:MAG: hypothetical protein NTW96_17400, partial [Planctomycetia bacterium]|nr:hypothetical protein [Planctomycetia bacterium]
MNEVYCHRADPPAGRRRVTGCRRVLLIAAMVLAPCLAGVAAVSEVRAADGGETAAPRTIRFHRLFAPADRPDDWPRGEGRYIPMDAAAFEKIVDRLRDPAPEVASRVVAAEYRATLEGDRLLRGGASLEIVHPADKTSLLSLGSCALAVGKAVWAGDKPVDATLGSAQDGNLAVEVSRPGKLELEWSLLGRRSETGSVEFDLELPPCPRSLLVLDLPRDVTASVDRGIVAAHAPAAEDRQTWRIELGGHRRVALRLARVEAAPRSGPLPRARQSLTYSLSPRGVEVTAELQLEVDQQPLRRVGLALDESLELVSAQCGEQPLRWSITSDPAGHGARAVLELPEAISGTSRTLRLGALAPLVTGRPWRLPRIRPEETFWQEGRATLLVPSPLQIERFTGIHCRQSKVGPLSAPRVGESIELQYFASDATAEIILADPATPVQVDCGTALELSAGGISGRLIAALKSVDRERFELEADLAGQWIVDSVDSVPGGSVADWSVRAGPDETRQLVIRLAKALSPSRGVLYLSIVGRRLQSPLGRGVTVDELAPLRFATARVGRRLLSVRAMEPYQLTTRGAEQLARIEPSRLDAKDLRLFAETPRGLLFVQDARAEPLRILLRQQEPGYAGTIRVEATVTGPTMSESYRLRCSPESSRLDHVLVHFSHARSGPPRWTLGTEEGQTLAARRLPPAEQSAVGLGPDGETWEVALTPSRSVPFEILATRDTELEEPGPICLAALPEATSQDATLVIRSAEATDVRIENRRLEPIPVEPPAAGRCQTARAAYRYDPTRVATSPTASVTVSVSRDATAPSALVWSCHLDSRYESDGTSRHLATYWLESSGRPRLRLVLPATATRADVRGVWIDDAPAASRQAEEGDSDRALVIDLPSGVRFPTVTIDFTANGSKLGIVDRLEPPLPEVDVEVLARHWTVWLPPGYVSLGDDLGWQPRRAAAPTWKERLFGPLGQAAHEHPFDPFAADDWAAINPLQPAHREIAGNAQQLQQLLGGLAHQRDTAQGNRPYTWGSLLTEPSIASLGLSLLVDREALAGVGLSPAAPVPGGLSTEPAAQGIELLQKADLAILLDQDTALVTTARQAALWRAQLEPLGGHVLWRVRPGALADRLREAAEEPGHALVSPRLWQASAGEVASPWRLSPRDGHRPSDTRGWNCYSMDFSSVGPIRLAVAHRASIESLRWIAMLLAIALGWWMAMNRPIILALVAGLSAIVALLTPPIVAVVASGVLLGLLCCLGFRLLAVKPQRGRPASDSARTRAAASTMTHAAATSLAVLLAVVPCSSAGDETPGNEPPPYRVFVPIDKGKKPTGGKVYVPEELYRELNRLAAGATEPEGWLLEEATYRGALAWQGTPKQLVPDDLRAVYVVRVFGRGATRVRLPLRREGLTLASGGVLLDGRVVQPTWDQDGASLGFDVSGPGRYRLELLLQPTLQDAKNPQTAATAPSGQVGQGGEAVRGFDLAIPRLVRSRLELTLPAGSSSVQVPSARGAVTVEDQQLVAQLGGADRLSVRWREDASGGAAEPLVEAEELLWLKIAPGSVVVDARLKFKVLRGRATEFLLAADPRLRLREPSSDAQIEEVPGSPRLRRIKLARPCSDQVAVAASFLLQESSGVGNLRLPQLGVEGVRVARRWFAVSVDPNLKYDVEGSGSL